MRDFHKICRVCTAFQDALAVKTLLDLLKGLWNYGGFKLTGYDIDTTRKAIECATTLPLTVFI